MKKADTLVAYASKGKATKEAAELIGEALEVEYGLSVDLVDLKKSTPETEDYTNLVIGSGVRMGRVYKRSLEFMDRDFSGKKVAVFLSSLEAGDEKSHNEAVDKYIEKEIKTRLNVEPVAGEAFGGRIKIFGFSVQDNIDREKIRVWAREVGEKFVSSSDD